MQKYFKKLFSAFIALLIALTSSITYIQTVQAEGPVEVAYYWSSDEAKVPVSILTMETALEYALSGTKIYLNQDWKIDSPITIPSDTTVTIEMNGHKIYRDLEDSEDNGEIFYLKSGSELHLLGNGDEKAGIDLTNNEITYLGYNNSNTSTTDDKYEFTVKTGGLITGGYSEDTAGAIYMESKSKLYLSNVAVNGNASDSTDAAGAIRLAGSSCYVEMDNAHVDHNYAYAAGGGIKVDGSYSHIVMKNNSSIDYNQVSDNSSYYYGGGGIAVLADKFTLDMALSSISYNHVNDSIGGGIYIRKTATINMDHSSIDYNVASADPSGVEVKSGNGGGIVVDGTDDIKGCLTLEGDYNSTISNNVSGRSGGGISLNTASEGSVIKKVIISNNTASSQAGGLYLPSNNNQINDCVLQNNTANSYGGGAYISQWNNVFRNCTIQNNHTNSEYGGGMYVYWMYDVTMHGNNIVDGNTNKDNKANNVYLDTWAGTGFSNAYIRGTSLEKAHIGISTNTTSSRKVGENITDYVEGRYFLDNPSNLHLVYYADDTVYQETGASKKYTLTVNGEEIGKYYSGEMVEISDRNTDSEKVFIEWDRSKTTGIDLSVAQRESQYFTISMPSNNVSTSATYLDRLKSLTITVNGNKPTAGKYLPEGMAIVKYGPESDSRRKGVDTEWLKVNDDSTMTPVSGRADYSTSYVFKVQIKKDINAHLIFSSSIKPEDITINYGDGTTKASSVSVDAAGTITIISEPITTANRVITSIDTDSITVNEGITKDELIASLPTTAIGYDSSNKQYVLTVGNITDDMISSLISDGKVIYPTDGSAVVTLPVTAPQGFDIATGIVFNVTVNVNALPTIESITDAYMSVKDGTSSTDFISELPRYAEVLASDESVKFLEVNTDSLGTQLDAYLTDGKIDINKGTAFDIYLTVNTDGTVKNPENKTLKVTVTVNDKDTVDVPTVTPASGTYKEQLVDGNLNVTVSYGDGEDIVKGDTIHYIVDNNKDDEKTCSLDEEHTSCTITLEGTANTKVTHTLEVWASATDKNDSTHIKNSYVLDNSIEVATPTVEPASGNYSGTSLTVSASTDQTEAKIYYIIDNGDPIEYDSTKGIELTTEKDVARTFNIKVWAEVSEVSSEIVERIYILDGYVDPDQYTVTINCSDTAIVKPDETAWSDKVIQSYDKNTKVIISAPSYEDQGKVFEKWIYKNEEGQTVESTEPTLTFTNLDSNKYVQAIYNPVITEINFNIPYPEVGKALATKDDISVTATVAGVSGKDITAYFDLENMSWLTNDTIADYETSYTLKLPILYNISNVRYVLDKDIVVTVSGNTDATANIDEKNLITYITFPETEENPIKPTPTPTPTATSETKKKDSGWDDGGPFTTDTCGNVFDRWGNKIYEATSCNVGGYNLVRTDSKD